MASPAHCFYCFECLDASFQRRDPPSLQRVLDSYEQYLAREESKAASDDDNDDQDAASVSSSNENEDEDDIEMSISSTSRSTRPQLPSISRLQQSSSSAPSKSSSRSSSASSPSTVSASSSQSHLTASTSATSMSTNTQASHGPKSTPQRQSYAKTLSITASYPLFVTWNTLTTSHRHGTSTPQKSLRGCIGTFEPLPLSTGLQTYSLTSAFDDTRFSPITSSLLPSLSCSLTLLADFEPCNDALDWVLGTHGLRISFSWKGRRHGATYLPDVAVEQGWGREETVESLMRKAGWDGSCHGHSHGSGGGGGYGYVGGVRRLLRGGGRSPERQGSSTSQGQGQTPGQGEGQSGGVAPVIKHPWDEVADFRAVRYTGLKASAGYAEWREWRSWADAQGDTLIK